MASHLAAAALRAIVDLPPSGKSYEIGEIHIIRVRGRPGRGTAASSDRVIAASEIVSAVPRAMKSMGELGVAAVGAGQTKLHWSPFGGSEACFSACKVVFSEEDPTPSYLEGSPHLAAIESQGADRYVVGAGELEPGHTYHFRVQALRFTDLGAFLVAQTSVATYTVP